MAGDKQRNGIFSAGVGDGANSGGTPNAGRNFSIGAGLALGNLRYGIPDLPLEFGASPFS